MNKDTTNTKKMRQIRELTEELEVLLNERIIETCDVKGQQGNRHALIYYRSFVYQIRDVADVGGEQ